MQEFSGKVAVVTGGASGIGYALAAQAVREGMRVVLADIEADTLDAAAQQLRATGGQVLAVRTDVADAAAVMALAERTQATYGGAHLLFNNAGVGNAGNIWEQSEAGWQWVLGVNLWGVIHGIRAFVPAMLVQGTECHIVNTASAAGLVSAGALGIYAISKHAVVALSETLAYQLARQGAAIGVSVLCPEFVQTRLGDAERNRLPTSPADASVASLASSPPSAWGEGAVAQAVRAAIAAGIAPETVAAATFAAIRAGKLYILTHPETKARVRVRLERIVAD